MIARLSAQKVCIDLAAAELVNTPGHVLEIGLGKARTYDRMRYVFPEREVYAFDYEIHCPKELTPPAENILHGDVHETLPVARDSFGRNIALAHADIGSFDPERDRDLFAFIASMLNEMLVSGAIVMSDRVFSEPTWERIPQPAGTEAWTYHMYRAP
jgi:hypothetical protein